MSGPDGLEQRTADEAEGNEREAERIDAIEERAEDDYGQARVFAAFLDRILQ